MENLLINNIFSILFIKFFFFLLKYYNYSMTKFMRSLDWFTIILHFRYTFNNI